ncbi:dUTP diphosphatase [Brevibacillus laterosporus]|uniref:dUTP diphosphatase n=1 Tax=Brevibacillus laterosporus TaxID=1465 RepID=A0AAP3DJB7_BRELA|nr:dUTP diphosphatase [Brevibacillus laterosporus]MCR8980920.1 dUTP diphosphatase [Brevibacillus laterosporus]MCZ0808075.1 dUTP diphosphatase [Brevibacillus laterosporus]MCZ0826267.1 dUTP diphosphatase [Brevibacillus laterosporus]MCZ0850150.1 dUTP diphosphatase [Brevibacillus laterosporus]
MEISLETLFEKQKQLDDYIIKKKGLDTLPKQELLNNTVLALQVEICELANEWRGFKHWSEDREPRTIAERGVCKMCAGTGAYPIESDDECPTCQGEGEQIYNPLLEEYVDCLHFFLSMARQLELSTDDLYAWEDQLEGETTILLTELLMNVGQIMGDQIFANKPKDVFQHRREHFRASLFIFYNLGEQRLGISYEDMVQAYLDKWKINIQRQESGY